MIRTTSQGAFVWFQLDSRKECKVTFRLDEYLAYVKTAQSETELRARLFSVGKISDMTPDDLNDIEFFRGGAPDRAGANGKKGRRPRVASALGEKVAVAGK